MTTSLAEAFDTSPLAIRTRSGAVHQFTVELATTPGQRSQGLMFRESMAPDHGMLFDFVEAQPVAFWMKNTKIPLDMIFTGQDGTILAIAPDTKPFDETPIGPDVPVRAVLELNAGTAARLGIAPGDKLQHPLFEK